MGRFLVRSNHGSNQLLVWTVKPGQEWRERFSGDALRLDAYFADLAQHWRGWDGDKEWESLGLRLAARHDGLGHVTLDATLDEDYAMAQR